MSSLEFDYQATLPDSMELKTIALCLCAYANGDLNAKDQLVSKNIPIQLLERIAPSDISIQSRDTRLTLHISAAPSIELSLFDQFVELLESHGVQQYRAKLFDTSSGGGQLWEKPEYLAAEEFNIQGKTILILGDTEEPYDEIVDILEGYEVTIEETLTDDTQLVIVGNDADSDVLNDVKEREIPILTEDDFWDLVESEP
jgi:NAD-dependent DNA ligase